MSPISWYYMRGATRSYLWQPTDDDGGGAGTQGAEDRQNVGGESSDGNHHALAMSRSNKSHLRQRGASRGVLEEAELRRGEVERWLVYGEMMEESVPSGTRGRSLGMMSESVLIHWSSGHWTPLREKKDFMLSSILA